MKNRDGSRLRENDSECRLSHRDAAHLLARGKATLDPKVERRLPESKPS
ncbi:hypothetical protein RMSM_06054 [Rhodopirellula maiorica SM1]|uniref:Uncharacterized protein n=1 Tax=Rhodopirellula maiorica SM1 TaxID=1265738 RepID=M5RCB7_9BACT|nr:hypothetical protein RMSM_06054 [Rhodopirellula maiorica SM1]